MSPLDRLAWLTKVRDAGAPLCALAVAIGVAHNDQGNGAWGELGGEAVEERAARKGRAWLVAHGFLATVRRGWSAVDPGGTPVPESGTDMPEVAARLCRQNGTPVPPTGTPVPESGTPVPQKEGGIEGGRKEGTPAPHPSDEQPGAGLGTWVRWQTSSPAVTAENSREIADLIRRFGKSTVQAVAERLAFQSRRKAWPNEITAALLASPQECPAPAAADPWTRAAAGLAPEGALALFACQRALREDWRAVAASFRKRFASAGELELAVTGNPALAIEWAEGRRTA